MVDSERGAEEKINKGRSLANPQRMHLFSLGYNVKLRIWGSPDAKSLMTASEQNSFKPPGLRLSLAAQCIRTDFPTSRTLVLKQLSKKNPACSGRFPNFQ